MTYILEKIIAMFIVALVGFTVATDAPRPQSEPYERVDVTPYLIEPTTTTSSTLFIDPYSSACKQFSALAVNLGWPIAERATLERVMFRESSCRPDAFNSKDPNGGSRGLMQINGFWTKYLKQKNIIKHPANLLHAQVNLLAALEIYNYGVDRYGYGWGPWKATK